MNSAQQHPFLFFFIDDPLPDCFGQKKGMTFRSLLTDEPRTDKITYDGIKRSFQNLHAEFDAFESFYAKLKKITDRNEFFTQQIIGKNKKTHTRGNNLFELVFSQDGRMDVSIIQNDGIKCVLILDVRISNHYDKSDNTVHAKNDSLAKRILSALDERNIYKTQTMVENDTIFKNGLIAYQNELLEAINTTEAKFEILLNTLDSLIFSNKNIEAKNSLFFDKLYDITQDLSTSEQKQFDSFVEQQLNSDNIKQYQKELLQKLWYFNPENENEKDELTVSFNKIKIAKTFAHPFLNQVTNILNTNTLNNKTMVDMYRILSKMPVSHLYVLQDELNDMLMDTQNTQTSSDISSVSAQKQTELFLEHLIHLKTYHTNNQYPHFKQICEDYYKGKLEPISSEEKHIISSTKTIDEVLYIPMNRLSDKEVINTLGSGLMHMIIHKNPSMRSLIDKPENENILNNSGTLGYQWFDETVNDETLLKAIDRLIFTPNKRIENMICEQYPFLANYIAAGRQNKRIPDYKLNSIYHSLKQYTSEKEFDDIYEELKTLSEHEQKILRSYFLSNYAKTSEDMDIGSYILSAFELIELEKAQKQKKKQKKEQIKKEKEDEKNANKQMRQEFMDIFNTFLSDIDNDEKKRTLEQALNSLNETVLSGLKTLPKNDIIGTFVRTYVQEKDKNNVTSAAFDPIILHARELKKSSLFDEINSFFNNPNQFNNTQKLETLCLSLSKNDWGYLLDICEQNPKLYAKEKMFLDMYQQNTDKNFASFLNHVQSEYTLLLAHEQEKRISQFETTLNVTLFSSDKKAEEHLLIACEALTIEDINVCLSEREMNIPAKILLQKITPIIEQNMPNSRDRIKTQIEMVKRLTDFQNTFAGYANDVTSKKYKGLLIKKYLQLTSQDLEIFVNLNRQDAFNETFFEKLLKNKRKNSDFKKQQEGVVEIIESTAKKLKFYDTFSGYLNQTLKNAHKTIVEQFLKLTENSDTELSEILHENKNKPLITFFLREMRDTKRSTPHKQQKQKLLELLEGTDWIVDFYQSIKHGMLAKEAAEKLYQNEPTQDNLDGIHVVNNIIKLQIEKLSLSEVTAILYAKIFEKNTLVHDEIIKSGFCKAVMRFKNKPMEKKSNLIVIAFCNELEDRHYADIMQEHGETSYITKFIQDFKKFSKNDSLNKVRKKLGNTEYLHHAMDFLHQKAVDVLKQDIERLQKKLRD